VFLEKQAEAEEIRFQDEWLNLGKLIDEEKDMMGDVLSAL
jgi:hypothetical protein